VDTDKAITDHKKWVSDQLSTAAKDSLAKKWGLPPSKQTKR
jgi:hypothetical protein